MSKIATHAIAYGTKVQNPNIPATDSKVSHHMEICKELNALFERKNHDYGDSFHQSFLEEGLAMARIRLGDKYNRFKTLSRQDSAQQINDESIRDTLIDLANYAIMTIMEIEQSERENGMMELDEAKRDDESTIDLKDPSAWSYPKDGNRTVSIFGSESPQDTTQGLSGTGSTSTLPLKKITADDLVEAYRLALEDANERTMCALDHVIAESRSEEGAFEADIVEEEKNKLLEGPYIGENERRSFDFSTDWK